NRECVQHEHSELAAWERAWGERNVGGLLYLGERLPSVRRPGYVKSFLPGCLGWSSHGLERGGVLTVTFTLVFFLLGCLGATVVKHIDFAVWADGRERALVTGLFGTVGYDTGRHRLAAVRRVRVGDIAPVL